MVEIKHQQQSLANSCTSACLAMILDMPEAKVVEEFHEAYHDRDSCELDYLRKYGVEGSPVISTERYTYFGHVYTLGVPSLNLQAEMHSVVLDLRYKDNCWLLDPNRGREGKKYYTLEDEKGELSVKLRGFVQDVVITAEALEKRHAAIV